jgi:hypothetical protein
LWALLAAGGLSGLPGVTLVGYAGQTCPNGSFLTGIDSQGNISCSASMSPSCSSTAFTVTITSFSFVDSDNSLTEEWWPSRTVTLGTGSCTASVQTPGPGINGPGGSTLGCVIDNTQGCQGWRSAVAVSGFSSCTVTPGATTCNSIGALPTGGAFPGCTSALSNNPHSTATATVTCNP